MKRISSLLVLGALLFTACTNVANTPSAAENTSAPDPNATATLPGPQVSTTETPDAKDAAAAYLDYWAAEDYENMYAMLSSLSKDAFPQEEFIDFYRLAAVNMSLQKMDYEITSALTNPRSA